MIKELAGHINIMYRHFKRIMELYVFENYKGLFPELEGSELTDQLIKEALIEHGAEMNEVLRTAKGKPYVDGEIFISVSHSENHFVCLIGEKNVGVDIQKERNANITKISSRYFTDNECEYVRNAGAEGFFRLWTRKEAYCKYTGLGLEEILKGTSVLEREDVEFFDFQLEKGLYCSCCMEK